MMDISFTVQVDNRFITSVYGPTGGTFTNSFSSTTTTFNALSTAMIGSSTTGIANYVDYSIKGLPNTVYYYASSTSPATDISAIAGPRGTVAKLNLGAAPGLTSRSTSGVRSPLWAKHGLTNQTLGSLTVDQLDTTVYIVGSRSGAQIQLPVRLTRYVSG